MAFKFKRKESTTKALRRLFTNRVDAALGHIHECETLDAVHAVRKEIKKLRALMRLMRAGLRKGDFRAAMCHLKEAARQFGPARDAHVTFQALGLVLGHFKGRLGPRTFADFRPPLRRACQEEEKRLRRKHLAAHVSRLLRRAQKRIEALSLRDEGWPVLGSGVKSSYRSGRKAWQQALAERIPENLHEWRKLVKELGYQLRLFCPIWPEQLDAALRELEMLGEALGEDHDLYMLTEAVKNNCTAGAPANELEALCGLITQRQDKLRRQALALGARFYAEKPSLFCRRLSDYWHLWRRRTARAHGKKRKLPELKAVVCEQKEGL